MQCPECKRRLPDVSDTCRCGWTRTKGSDGVFIHCAVESCGTCAMTRVKTTTGMANLCIEHYDAYHLKQGRHFCQTRGLDTREKQMAFIKKTMAAGKMFKGVPRMREPGDDDDMPVAA